MALLERVSTLLRANLNDLLARAEDPEKLARQLLLDMENQLLQVKTQVAIAIADQHLLLKKQQTQQQEQSQWHRKAELAVAKQQDDLARAALERALSHQRLAEGLAQQHADQTAEAETLRAAYTRLQTKLLETRDKVELLTLQLRRNKAALKASTQGTAANQPTLNPSAKLAALTASAQNLEARAHVTRTLTAIHSAETLEDRFQSLERNDEIESLLLELKAAQPRIATVQSEQALIGKNIA